MAVDAIHEGKNGLMTAIVERLLRAGADPRSQARPAHVDVASTYNTERYRPTYDNKLGLPVFSQSRGVGAAITCDSDATGVNDG